MAIVLARSDTVVNVTAFSGFVLASATGDAIAIGASTLTKSTTWKVVGVAVSRSRMVSCWRGSIVMSGRRPICSTPEIAVPTAASVIVVLRSNNVRAVLPVKVITALPRLSFRRRWTPASFFICSSKDVFVFRTPARARRVCVDGVRLFLDRVDLRLQFFRNGAVLSVARQLFRNGSSARPAGPAVSSSIFVFLFRLEFPGVTLPELAT